MISYKHLLDALTIFSLYYLWNKRFIYINSVKSEEDKNAHDRLETIIMVISFFVTIILATNLLWEIVTGKRIW